MADEDIWIIAASLPLMLVLTLFLGFETSFYYGISLFGLSFWMLGSGRTKRFGVIICIIGILLFLMAFIYYIRTGIVPPEKPFEFSAIGSYF